MENQQLHNQDNPCPQKSISDRKFVIFDLDGTLIDSFECVLRCVNKTLETFAIPHIEIQSIESFNDIEIIFNKAKEVIHESIPFDDFKKRFDKIHYDDCIDGIIVKQNVYNCLITLIRNKYSIVILTNKHQSIANKIVDNFFHGLDIQVLGRTSNTPIKNGYCYKELLTKLHNISYDGYEGFFGDTLQDERTAAYLSIPFFNVTEL